MMIRNTEADYWFFVGLSSAAMELNDGSWYLELERDDGKETNALLWPTYKDNGCQTQSG